MPAATEKNSEKIRKLDATIEGARNLLIVLQDHPDPDAIAAGVGLRAVVHHLEDVQCSFVHGGTVGRGENRALVQYLALRLRPVTDIDIDDYDCIAMVDAQPGTGNSSLPGEVVPDIVIDHHTIRNATRKAKFTDIRSRYGATATILWEYLNEVGINPEMPLATALLYAIRSDTQDLGREATDADIAAAEALHPLANKRMLGQIQRGRVPGVYFQMLNDALSEAMIYPGAIVAGLGDIHNADMLGEAADLFLRHEDVEWSLTHGFYDGSLLVSIRTLDGEPRADDVAKKIASRIGTGGGHAMLAGAQIHVKKDTARGRKELAAKVSARFLKAIGSSGKSGSRLVSS
jgi:nanoRNase/pAp phosphatase (c-di-AMP/oligoRNAs hydrolase)